MSKMTLLQRDYMAKMEKFFGNKRLLTGVFFKRTIFEIFVSRTRSTHGCGTQGKVIYGKLGPLVCFPLPSHNSHFQRLEPGSVCSIFECHL